MKNRVLQQFTLATLMFLMLSCSSKSKYEAAFRVVKYEVILTERSVAKDTVTKELYDTFFKDEAFIKFFDTDSLSFLTSLGYYSKGTWSHDDEAGTFDINIGPLGSMTYQKQEEEGEGKGLDYLVLKSRNSKGLTVNLLLKKDDYFESDKTDLLSLPLNWWRIKPTKSESKAQIKRRVLAQIDYMISYFELISDKKYGSFQSKPLVCPFSLFANGIGLDPSGVQDYNQLFFDDTDAAFAYNLLKGGLNSISVYPADKESYTKGYANALKEIRKFIELS